MIRQFEEPEQLPTPQGAGGQPTPKILSFENIVLTKKSIYDGLRI